MSKATDLVTEFIGSWARGNVDEIIDYFADDAVYINIPMDPPNIGKPAIRAFIEGFMGMAEKIEFRIHHQGEAGAGVVMNERTDRFLIKGQWLELPVMGIFEIEDGKIKAWRDYFDLQQFSSKLS